MRYDIPDDVAATAGFRAGDELVAEPTPDGVLVRVDALRRAYVEVTGQCNLRCTLCPRPGWAQGADHMTVPCFEALLAGMPDGGITLAFGGFGEPTIHPEFMQLVARARAAGCRVELITNGTTMSASLARDLVGLDVAQISFSLDGGDDASHEAMRSASRAAVLDGVSRLADERRRGGRRLAIGLACVATRRNAASLPAVLDTARGLGVDFVSISNAIPHTAEAADDILWHYAAHVSGSSPQSWSPRVTVARFDLTGVTRPLVEAIWRQLPVVPPPAVDGGTWRNRCRFVREGTVAISWDGRVAPCLSLLYTHAEFIGGREKTVKSWTLGLVQDTPLRDIWRSGTCRAFRARVREFDVSPCLSCGGCVISETNEGDCFGTPFPACSECLWAQGIVLCP